MLAPAETRRRVERLPIARDVIIKTRQSFQKRFPYPIYFMSARLVPEGDSVDTFMGKGSTYDQSFCSALFEALERYFTSLRCTDPIITGSYNRSGEYASNQELFGRCKGTAYSAGLDIESVQGPSRAGRWQKIWRAGGNLTSFPGRENGKNLTDTRLSSDRSPARQDNRSFTVFHWCSQGLQ